jgi:hypothetical protein
VVDPISAVGAAVTLSELVGALGLVRSKSEVALERIAADTRELIRAPLYEGLKRIEYAEKAADPGLRVELIKEARSKLMDAVSRPGVPASLCVLACVLSAKLAQLGPNVGEPAFWAQQALDACDRWLIEVQVEANATALLGSIPSTDTSLVLRAGRRATRTVALIRAGLRNARHSPDTTSPLATGRIDEVNRQVAAVQTFAETLGVAPRGRYSHVAMTRFGALVVSTHLVRHSD